MYQTNFNTNWNEQEIIALCEGWKEEFYEEGHRDETKTHFESRVFKNFNSRPSRLQERSKEEISSKMASILKWASFVASYNSGRLPGTKGRVNWYEENPQIRLEYLQSEYARGQVEISDFALQSISPIFKDNAVVNPPFILQTSIQNSENLLTDSNIGQSNTNPTEGLTSLANSGNVVEDQTERSKRSGEAKDLGEELKNDRDDKGEKKRQRLLSDLRDLNDDLIKKQKVAFKELLSTFLTPRTNP